MGYEYMSDEDNDGEDVRCTFTSVVQQLSQYPNSSLDQRVVQRRRKGEMPRGFQDPS